MNPDNIDLIFRDTSLVFSNFYSIDFSSVSPSDFYGEFLLDLKGNHVIEWTDNFFTEEMEEYCLVRVVPRFEKKRMTEMEFLFLRSDEVFKLIDIKVSGYDLIEK